MEKLKKWRAASKMGPHVFHQFLNHLHAAINNKQILPTRKRTSRIDHNIDEAIEDQTSIGYLQALQGRISTKWRKAEALAKGQRYESL